MESPTEGKKQLGRQGTSDRSRRNLATEARFSRKSLSDHN